MAAASPSSQPQTSPAPTRSRSSSIASSNGLPPTFDDLAPQRAPTTQPAEETLIPIPGIAPIPHSFHTACPGGSNADLAAAPVQGGGKDIGGVRLHVDAGPGCGGIAWPAGEVLSRYMAYRHEVDPSFLKGKKVLELGSGTGLVGLAVGLLEKSSQVEVTDQAVLLDLMQRNIELNYPSSPSSSTSPAPAPASVTASTLPASDSDTARSADSAHGAGPEAAAAPPAPPAHSSSLASSPKPNVIASELNWGDPLPPHIDITELDFVLAADCVYFEPAFPLLLQTLLDLSPLPPHKPVPIYFCWKKRRKADKRFFAMLRKHFDSAHVEDDRPGAREVYGREGVSLLVLTRKR